MGLRKLKLHYSKFEPFVRFIKQEKIVYFLLMALPVTVHNRTKIYNVSGYDSGKLPDWLLQKHRRQLKKDVAYGRRIELVQEFEFPEASTTIQLTRDERHIVATGTYKPQIRVYDLEELSLKFERHTTAETVSLTLLEEDWTKLLLLQADKKLEFHTQGGFYYSAPIPLVKRQFHLRVGIVLFSCSCFRV
jgi:ribosome biogenesis protein ENP2